MLVGVDEQIKRLSAARFQLDVMQVPGIIVARTDAEAATFLEGRGDERDHPFILGATNVELPTYKVGFLAILRKLRELGVEDAARSSAVRDLRGGVRRGRRWLDADGRDARRSKRARRRSEQADGSRSRHCWTGSRRAYLEAWQAEANLKSYPEAVADVIEFRANEGERFDMSADEWLAFANRTSFHAGPARAKSMGIDIVWDCEVSKTPEGYYQVQGGIEYAIARSLAVAPFADILWMETKTADLADARRFAEAIHAEFPAKMLAYNLSPSFNWDTTGMSDEEMRRFPRGARQAGVRLQLHHLRRTPDRRPGGGGVRHRAQAGRHALPGPAAAKVPPGRIALPDAADARGRAAAGCGADGFFGRHGGDQSDGQGLDAAPAPGPDRGADQAARGMARDVGEAPPDPGLAASRSCGRTRRARSCWSSRCLKTSGEKVANIIFDVIEDRRGHNMLSVRDQNTFDIALRKKRLMTLNHLFLVHRYKIWSVHYVSPTDDNRYQAQKMRTHGLFSDVHDEVGDVIVADVSTEGVRALLAPDRDRLNALIQRKYPYEPVEVAAQTMQRTGRGERT